MRLSILSMLSCRIGKQTDYVTEDYAFAWGNALDDLKQSNINLCNPQHQLFQQFAEQTEVAINVLKAGEVQLVNLADTMLIEGHSKVPLAFNRADIHTVGIGIQQSQAQQPFEFQKEDVKVGVIGFSNKDEHAEQASEGPGIFYTPFGYAEPLKPLIDEIKREVDICIALIQWGSEKPEPNAMYQKYARSLIDAGVDIIHGESDHVYLGVERYKDSLIMYDSGDFVDIYMTDIEKESVPRSFIYELDLNKDGLQGARLTPVLLRDNALTKAYSHNKSDAINLMQTISKNLGTTISDDGEIEL